MALKYAKISWDALKNMLILIELIFIILGIIGLIFITWWFHFRKHILLSKRINDCDETLLSDSGLNIGSVFQPAGI